MYKDYFRLDELPFSIAPDPRFLYMSARHREAIAHLLYGVEGAGGLVLLTGEIGTGKTTLCRRLIEQIHTSCDVAIILNPKLGVEELLETICNEFHIEVPARWVRIKALIDAINEHLLRLNAAGRRAVLIIDEAQNLQPVVLEQLRLLTNLETNTRKLLQIVLIGQPELNELLAQPDMRQVAQRIVARYHLAHLTPQEIGAYVNHRLRVAGALAPLFPLNLMTPLYRATRGVPRLINLVCDRALLGTQVQGKLQVTRQTLRQATREVFGALAPQAAWRRFARSLALVSALGGCGALVAYSFPQVAADWPVHGTPSPAKVARAAPAAIRPTAPPPAVEQPEFVALHLPDDPAARKDSEKLAVQALFKLYGSDLKPSAKDDPCAPAPAASAPALRCLHSRGGLADLHRFDQPAVLALGGDAGKPDYYAVLTALDDESATLSIGGANRRIRLNDLAQAWSGDFIVAQWQGAAGAGSVLSSGSRNPAVAQLRQDLARLQGGSPDGPAEFDADLLRRVKTFQLAEGIVPDGVAGAVTLARLRMRIDPSRPRLTHPVQNGNVVHP